MNNLSDNKEKDFNGKEEKNYTCIKDKIMFLQQRKY